MNQCSPHRGEHNDLLNFNDQFMELLQLLESATISHDGIFLNADTGFVSEDLLNYAKKITRIEPANAWMDAFKALLVR